MRALIQRVSAASVDIDGCEFAAIGRGLLILLGVTHDDDANDAAFLADKCVNMRIFEDSCDKMNLALSDIGGEALVVSQFTLYGDASHGRRPSFTAAARPEPAEKLYENFVDQIRKIGIKTQTGRFGASMQLTIHNDGPVTIIVDSRKKSEKTSI